MYTKINKYTFLISLTLAGITGRLLVILDFIVTYDDFAMDVFRFSVLNAVGQLFIYRMVK